MRLLIADDDVILGDILSLSMKRSGYEVDQAKDGFEAMEYVNKVSYDVVILCANMPGISSAEVCDFIKLRSPNTYIIGISGSPDSLKELHDEGADICFTKPDCIEY